MDPFNYRNFRSRTLEVTFLRNTVKEKHKVNKLPTI